jgi:putative N-acetyltransferase (TIGR04045 family)
MDRVAAVSPFSTSTEVEEAAALRRPDVSCRPASSPEELEIHHAIRHRVFVEEQAFFRETDRDEHDEDPAPLHVLGLCGRVACGAVRLYPLEEPGVWKGDRLAVLRAFRRRRVGAPLVRFAVHTAAGRGGDRMIAHVQVSNVSFFERLGWVAEGDPEEYVGHPHQVMAIDLRSLR